MPPHNVTLIKCVKVFGLSAFIIAVVAVAATIVYIPTSPLSSSPNACIVDCSRVSASSGAHVSSRRHDGTVCVQCAWSSSGAFFFTFLTVLFGAILVFSIFATAFSNPGIVAAAASDVGGVGVVNEEAEDAEEQQQQPSDGTADERPSNDSPHAEAGDVDDDEDDDDAQLVSSSATSGPAAIEAYQARRRRGQQQQHEQAQHHNQHQRLYRWEVGAGRSDICVWSDTAHAVVNYVRPPLSRDSSAAVEIKPQLKFCNTCGVPRPPRAAHCRRHAVCVRNFSHCCIVTDNCIGQDNIASFRAMIYSGFLLTLTSLVGSAYTYAEVLLELSVHDEQLYKNSESAALTLMILAIFSIVPLLIFTLLHLRLHLFLGGMTVREFVRRGVAFSSHDFATQFDDPLSKLIRTLHCGRGGALGDLMACCACCFLCGYGADGEGPTYCCCNACGPEFDERGEDARHVVVPRPCEARL